MIKYLSALLMREINEAKTENMVEFLDMSLPEEKKKKINFHTPNYQYLSIFSTDPSSHESNQFHEFEAMMGTFWRDFCTFLPPEDSCKRNYNKKLPINASDFACLETNYEHILQLSSRSTIILVPSSQNINHHMLNI
jgi:hypothetical protein